MVALLKKEVVARGATEQTKPFVIYDLGSGSGTLARRIAKEIPQSRVVGIELSFIPYYLG